MAHLVGMGNEAPPETQENVIDVVEKAILSGKDPVTGEDTQLLAEDGILYTLIITPGGQEITDALNNVANDEYRMRLFGVDDTGTLAEVQTGDLGTALGGAETALVTYISQALSSIGNDDLRVALQADNLGTNLDVDLAEQSLDQLTATIEGDDDGGNTAEVQIQELGSALAGGETGLITYLAQALQTISNDQLRVDLENYNGGTLPTEQQSPVAVEDTQGTKLDLLARQDVSPVTDSVSTATSNATLVLGDYRRDVDWFVDVSGAATLTVEVRTSGGTWRTFDTVDYASGTTEVEQYNTSFAEMQARVDQNLNTLEGSSKGV